MQTALHLRQFLILTSALLALTPVSAQEAKPTYPIVDTGVIEFYSDSATISKADSGKGMDWKDALAYAESLKLAGHNDWRLPNAKELQSIVDYSRSPQSTSSAALDPLFEISAMRNSDGKKQYPFFWTSTTHLDVHNPYRSATSQ